MRYRQLHAHVSIRVIMEALHQAQRDGPVRRRIQRRVKLPVELPPPRNFTALQCALVSNEDFVEPLEMFCREMRDRASEESGFRFGAQLEHLVDLFEREL